MAENRAGAGGYVTTDHLGSTRLLTNSAGGVNARYDYEPFGPEIGAPYDGRTTAQGYTTAPDEANPKFTGQQRDQETTLDWFNVRYYSGAQGRFQSPDPANAGADPSNPQSWNGYAYVGNNPLSYTDPSGMLTETGGDGGDDGDGGLVGVIVSGIVDAFEAIFGGGGPPPSIAPSLATPSSPILGPTFSVTGWGTADTVGPSWSAVDGVLPILIPGLTFYAQGTGQQAPSNGVATRTRIYCQADVIGSMTRAWAASANGMSKFEAGFFGQWYSRRSIYHSLRHINTRSHENKDCYFRQYLCNVSRASKRRQSLAYRPAGHVPGERE
jgi:RHS repeat-associated protein